MTDFRKCLRHIHRDKTNHINSLSGIQTEKALKMKNENHQLEMKISRKFLNYLKISVQKVFIIVIITKLVKVWQIEVVITETLNDCLGKGL